MNLIYFNEYKFLDFAVFLLIAQAATQAPPTAPAASNV